MYTVIIKTAKPMTFKTGDRRAAIWLLMQAVAKGYKGEIYNGL